TARFLHESEADSLNSSSSSARKTDLIRDPVGPTLFRSTVPTTVGAAAMVLYYLADTWFIGLLGTDELAALGFTFPLTILVSYFGVGLGIGTSALAGKALGSSDTKEAARITLASMLFALLAGLAMIFLARSAIGWIFPMLGAGP